MIKSFAIQSTARHLALGLLLGLSALGTAPSFADTPVKAVTATEFRSLLKQQAGKVVVVNLWATWCVPCLREVPDLLKLEAEFAARGVTLIGVAVDDPSPGAVQVEQFRKKYFPAFLTYARTGPEMDELASVIDPAWNEVVPTTYILDRTGKPVVRIQGKKSLDEFRAAVQKVL
ncbi:MAG: hypothetical protein RL245_1795 [Pseudomonadota bacterium]